MEIFIDRVAFTKCVEHWFVEKNGGIFLHVDEQTCPDDWTQFELDINALNGLLVRFTFLIGSLKLISIGILTS